MRTFHGAALRGVPLVAALLFCLALAGQAQAQTYSISGTVKLAGVGFWNVTVKPSSGTAVTTDANGAYTISGLAAGTYTITPSKTDCTFTPAFWSVTVGPSATLKDFTAWVSGIYDEDFETGGLTKWPWTSYSTSGWHWMVTSAEKHGGTYSAKADTIGNDGYTWLSVSLTRAAGTVSFYCKVSSQSVYDKLEFFIDGVAQGSGWSGEQGWVKATCSVPAGTHEYAWEYSKNSYTSAGSDTAWIDDINFPPPPADYWIAGHVATTGIDWIPGVTVTATGGLSTTTNANGCYIFSGLLAGTYAVTPAKAEYTFAPASSSVTVGPSTDEVNFVGTVDTYTVSGSVKTGGGGAIAGATVTADSGASATTDAAGNYTISGLEAGTYTLTPTKTEYTFLPTSSSVTVGPDATGKDFVGTANTYTISGTVTLDGAGFTGVTVTSSSGAAVTTGAGGAFTIGGLVAGTYRITPTKEGYSFASTYMNVTVGPNATGKNFVATLITYYIHGRITSGGVALPGVTVTPSSGAADTTDSDGYYIIDDLLPGTYTVTPAKTNYTFSPVSTSVTVGPSTWTADFAATGIPAISLAPTCLTFSAVPGGANPASQTLDIWNSALETLNWSVSDDASWLSLSPTSGTSTGEHDTVTAAVDIAGLAGGTYTATVTAADSAAGNSPQTVAVTLYVGPAAPVMAPEPETTPGTSNQVSWSSVTGADQYEAQCSPDAGFTGTPAGTGWQAPTTATFGDLTIGQRYWYRARGGRVGAGGDDDLGADVAGRLRERRL